MWRLDAQTVPSRVSTNSLHGFLRPRLRQREPVKSAGIFPSDFARLRAIPKSPVAVLQKTFDHAARQPRRVRIIKALESHAVEACQAVERRQPEIAIARLDHFVNPRRRQPVLNLPVDDDEIGILRVPNYPPKPNPRARARKAEGKKKSGCHCGKMPGKFRMLSFGQSLQQHP